MSARSAPARRSSAATRAAARRRALGRRRRIAWLLGVVLGMAGLFVAFSDPVDRVVQELRLPLRHEDVIRQQAADKGLDPALIAAVIYSESHFRDQTSSAGAKGLMQLMPDTADYIAQLSGGTAFEQGDLATPQINIAYGSFYLQYLLEKYDGKVVLALAAYNAGEGKVDEWRTSAAAGGETFDVATHIPFPETRAYVVKVLDARKEYRKQYARELGL